MDNDNKIKDLIKSETAAFFTRALREIRKEKKEFNLEEEFAKSKRYKNYTVQVVVLATILVCVAGVALILGAFNAGSKSEELSITAFEDQNLKQILEDIKRSRDRLETLKRELAEIKKEYDKELFDARADLAHYLELNAALYPDEAELKERNQERIKAADRTIASIRAKYDPMIAAKQSEIDQVERSLAEYDQRAVEQAKRTEDYLNNQQKLFQLEKDKIVASYEKEIAALEGKQEAERERYALQREELTKALEAQKLRELDLLTKLYNPTFMSEPLSGLIAGYAGNESAEYKPAAYPDVLRLDGVLDAASYEKLVSSVSAYLSVLKALRAVPYTNSVPPALAMVESKSLEALSAFEAQMLKAAEVISKKRAEISANIAEIADLKAKLSYSKGVIAQHLGALAAMSQDRREHGYIIDASPRDAMRVYINPSIKAAAGTEAWVFRDDNLVASVSIFYKDGESFAKVLELQQGASIRPFDKLLVSQ